MTEERLPLESRALAVMLQARGWKANRLARRLGVQPNTLYLYLKGKPKPSYELLERSAAAMGFLPVEVPRTLDYLRQLEGGEAPVDPEIERLATEMAQELEAPLRAGLRRWRRRLLAGRERLLAPALWERLKKYAPEQRRGVVREVKAFHSAGLVALLCEKSVEAAADDADAAVELADLARVTAETVEGESRRARALRSAWAHLGNARRVHGDLPASDGAFRQAAGFWQAGEDETGLFDEARVLDLEASLRREQRDLPAALALLDRGLAADPTGSRAGRILVKRAKTLEEMGDSEEAIATLRRALPLIDGQREPRLLWNARFNLLVNFCDAGRYAEAEESLRGVQELAERLGNELDLARQVWLRARIAAGLGQVAEAAAGLQQVRREFLARRIAYDAALVSLELAVLCLDQGRTAEVRAIAAELLPVFKAQQVTREALGTVQLFCDAARQETLTAAMARQWLKELRQAARPSPALPLPPPGPQSPGRRETGSRKGSLG